MPLYLGELSMPPGDPAGMRALARAIRSRATAVADGDHTMMATAAAIAWEGPAAGRFRVRIAQMHGHNRVSISRLQQVAQMLATAAAQVEQDQRRVQAENQLIREAALAEARRRALAGG